MSILGLGALASLALSDKLPASYSGPAGGGSVAQVPGGPVDLSGGATIIPAGGGAVGILNGPAFGGPGAGGFGGNGGFGGAGAVNGGFGGAGAVNGGAGGFGGPGAGGFGGPGAGGPGGFGGPGAGGPGGFGGPGAGGPGGFGGPGAGGFDGPGAGGFGPGGAGEGGPGGPDGDSDSIGATSGGGAQGSVIHGLRPNEVVHSVSHANLVQTSFDLGSDDHSPAVPGGPIILAGGEGAGLLVSDGVPVALGTGHRRTPYGNK